MEFFGLDIGSYSIKAIQLAKKTDKYQLVAFGSALLTTKGLISEAESDLNALSETIKKLHQETRIRTKNVVSALPQDQVFTRLITLPKLSEEELDSAIKWEAEQYIPMPLEEVVLSYQLVGEVKEDNRQKIEVLLAAAPRHLLEKTTNILQAAGLNPISLEMEIMALARSLVIPGESVMVVDLGAKATDLAIVENAQVIFVHSIPTAGDALTRAVELELGLESPQAEAYKKAYGVDVRKLEGKVVGAIAPILEEIITEMEKTIQFYQSKGKSLNRVVLAGGTAGLPEVANLLAKKLNLEIQMGNPFSRLVEDTLVKKMPIGDVSLYATAVGLAMKEIS